MLRAAVSGGGTTTGGVVRRIAKRAALGVGTASAVTGVAATAYAFSEQGLGFQRELQFWGVVSPIVLDYWWHAASSSPYVKYQKRIHPSSAETNDDDDDDDDDEITKQHNISLEAHMIRTEKVLLDNAKLEQRIETIQGTMKEIETKSANEQQNLQAEIARLEQELNTAAGNARKKIDALQQMEQTMQLQLERNQNERTILVEQIEELKMELEDSRGRLEESKAMLQALQQNVAEERRSFVEEREELKSSGSVMEQEMEDLRQTNLDLKASLANYEEKIDMLENVLLPESEQQLQSALDKLERFEQNKDEIHADTLQIQQRIESLTEELSQMQEGREEERKHFQELNEESSHAYQQMKVDLLEKADLIHDLKAQAAETSTRLALESQKLNDATEELKNLRATMNARTADLEKALEEVSNDLGECTKEKQVLERKLEAAMEQMQENSTVKEEVLARSMEASAANEALQRRILKLEQELQTSKSECNDAKKQAETFNERETKLYNQLQESDRVRRGLHNRVMQLSGNIRVYVRVRPMIAGEKGGSKTSQQVPPSGKKKRKHDEIVEESPFHYPGMGGQLYESTTASSKSTFGADDPTKNLLEVTEPWRDRGGLSERRKKWKFGFDNVFTPQHNQEDIWEATAPLVQSAVDGYNVTVFAYGQTGSGKTFTMLGEPGNEGIVARSVRMLFAAKESISELTRGESKVEISVELLEVYNEKVRDLLDSSNADQAASLKVKANAAVGSTLIATNSEEEVASILEKAQSRRCVKATSSNAVSSRSHMLFSIYFRVILKDGSSRIGKLNVCDLAGSERLGKSNANEDVGGALLKETKHINTSLSVLSNVIEKLQTGDSNIPYRESKLTHLLQNSLGGNSKTLAIVCCNPLQSHFHESLCSLRFAAKVNKVDLKAVANFSA